MKDLLSDTLSDTLKEIVEAAALNKKAQEKAAGASGGLRNQERYNMKSSNIISDSGASVNTKLYKKASEIEEKPVPWLIEGDIVRGAVQGWRGLPGDGKSYLTTALAVAVAGGGKWYSHSGELVDVPKGRVLIANYDDDEEYTIKPRLRECGATPEILQNIEVLDSAACADCCFSDERLARVFDEVKPDLAIFDTLQYFFGAADMHRANETNAALAPIQRLAKKHNAAVLVIEHLGKSAAVRSAHSLNWGLGSAAIPGLLRLVWTIGELRGGGFDYPPGTRAICRSKANILKYAPPARLFRIKDSGGIEWLGTDADITPFDLIQPDGGNDREQGRPGDQREDAKQIIMRLLAENGGEMPSIDLFDAAIKEGVSERTYKRARQELVFIDSVQRSRQWYTVLKKEP